MESYIAPGVYVTETTTLPYSVVEVSTAVPAFIGYTQLGPAASEPPKVARINSILDFESVFGGPQLSHYSVNAQQDPASAEWSATIADTTKEAEFRFYYSLYLFFHNGGGSCVVISVGNYSDYPAEKSRFTAGLRALEKEDEPTLILFPDAVTLLPATDYYTLCQESLAQGSNLEDRFAILDVPAENESDAGNIVEFRNGIGTTALQFGAAYHPFLQTSMSFRYNDDDVIINVSGAAFSGSPITLSEIRSSHSELYLLVRKTLSDQRIALPPSGAVAGIYARVDKQRGVWKAPANVSIAGVVGPTIAISSEEQDGLNVDPIAGKSINAIRTFTGRGILIWGARTLAGNNNEWRYISVRRLHNVIKESTKKSTAFFVFEPNDVNTWVKVQSMIESYLTVLWRQGALQGSKPEEAYYVRIGLGQSMSEVDVLEGRMIVEIGFAPVRPAEFIIIRFSHQLHSDNPIAPLGHQTETTISSTLIPMWPVSTEEALTNPGINLASSASFPARRIQTALNWEDLALAPGTKRQIDEVGHWIEHSATLKNSWGMANNFRSGYRCLFHGASGTGKTLAACLLGKSTGYDVYQINLSMVVSKYIGETEKNLSAVFDRAQDKKWILFFDEADALFGKRGISSDSASRYANQEVSYLLQRTENFAGVCIFAANFKQLMDSVLLRRFESMVYFPVPGPEQRLTLWKQTIPLKATLEEGVDIEVIASKYSLTACAIINVIRYSALQALARGDSVLRLEDIQQGIQRESEREHEDT